MKYLLLFTFFILGTKSVWATECYTIPACQNLKEKKRVHLSYDDGPDLNITPKILDHLNRHNVKASFFVSTIRLKQEKKERIQSLFRNMLENGHLIGNHGHEHNAHDLRLINNKCDPSQLSAQESQYQIDKSIRLLNEYTDIDGLNKNFANQKHKLFRFPYGRGAIPSPVEIYNLKKNGFKNYCTEGYASSGFSGIENRKESLEVRKNDLRTYRTQRSNALKRTAGRGFDHLGWNFDSQDSGARRSLEPIEMAKEVLRSMCEAKQKNLVSLFHDFNKKNAPKMTEYLVRCAKDNNINFVSYDTIYPYIQNNLSVLQKKDPFLNHKALKIANQALKSSRTVGSVKKPCTTQDSAQNYQKNDRFRPRKGFERLSSQCNSVYRPKPLVQCEGEVSICVNGKFLNVETRMDEILKECVRVK